MTRFDWCTHGHHTLCHHIAHTADGTEVRCGCGCHEREESSA